MPEELKAAVRKVVAKKDEPAQPSARSGAGWYYAATFLAIVGLESIPRFFFELQKPLMLPQRLVLLLIFFGVTWFFTHAMHDEMRWGVLSSMFFADAVITSFLAITLVAQISWPLLVYLTLAIIVFRAFLFAYLVSHRLAHLRGLVFWAGAILLVAGELVITFGSLPF